VIGGAAGLGYAIATPRPSGGMAAPPGAQRLLAALATGTAVALGGLLLTWNGSLLGGVSLDYLARTFPGSEVGLHPLALLLGESEPGARTRSLLAVFEGLVFGAGLALGLTRRPPG
jgi:hypothetical protein